MSFVARDHTLAEAPTAERLAALASRFVPAAAEVGKTLGTAESLTAGMLASTVASVPGASAVLRGGLVVYATDLKAALAGVPEDVLDRHGAVSAETAAALAEGAASRCSATIGVGLTGVAGPDLQEGHPAGTVYIGVSGAGDGAVEVLRLALPGGRADIRAGATAAALEYLVAALGA